MRKKTCSKCKEYKELDHFHNCKSSPDGKQYYCKKCQYERNKVYKYRYGKYRPTRDKEKERDYQKIYRAKRIKENEKEWRDYNRQKQKECRDRKKFKQFQAILNNENLQTL